MIVFSLNKMPPEHGISDDVMYEKEDTSQKVAENMNVEREYKADIVWKNVAYIMYFHLAALYGVYLMFTSAKLATFIFGKIFMLTHAC